MLQEKVKLFNLILFFLKQRLFIGSYEKTKILLVHGANPNKQCSTGYKKYNIIFLKFIFFYSRDTALNLAVHRQKYPVVDLLLQYRANPNLYNQSGKTALHRAVVSYNEEHIHHIQALLNVNIFKIHF